MKEKKLTDEVVVAKNAITDEEIVKALECCVDDENVNCEDCPLVRESCAVIRKYALDLINRQKAEIKRLGKVETELQDLNIEYYNDAKDLRRENKDLQKQVDELKEERKNMQAEIIGLESQKEDLYFQNQNLQAYIENHEEIWKRNAMIETAELQKQVDKLKKEKMLLIEVCDYCPKVLTEVSQSVKDTAKEILQIITKHPTTYLQMLTEIKERYNLEVE